MKELTLIFIFCGLFFIAQSQNSKEVSVESSSSGVQLGVMSIWGYHEAKLSKSWVIRKEVGFGGVYLNPPKEEKIVIFGVGLNLEPRYYYNLNKRYNAGKRIDKNSANFFSTKIIYIPKLFYRGNQPHLKSLSMVWIIPTWGIKRHIGKNFMYEVGIGANFPILSKSVAYQSLMKYYPLPFVPYAHVRIGYSF